MSSVRTIRKKRSRKIKRENKALAASLAAVRKCQGYTLQGNKCTRNATVNVDLTKEKKILGYDIPSINCCFFCSQHAALVTGSGAMKLAEWLMTINLDWDQYIALRPDYLENAIKSLTSLSFLNSNLAIPINLSFNSDSNISLIILLEFNL